MAEILTLYLFLLLNFIPHTHTHTTYKFSLDSYKFFKKKFEKSIYSHYYDCYFCLSYTQYIISKCFYYCVKITIIKPNYNINLYILC